MMRAPYQKSSGIGDGIINYGELYFTTVIYGNTNDTLIVPRSDQPGIYAYAEIGGVQPSTSGTGLLYLQDADANFPALDSNADPSSFGILILAGDAAAPVAVGLPAAGYSPQPVLQLLRGPAGVTATLSNRGGGTDGVTTSGNLAFSVSCAGADFDAAIAPFEFFWRVVYKRNINAV